MPQSLSIALSMVILYGALAAGYLARRRSPAIADKSPGLIRFNLLFIDSPLVAVIFWMLAPEDRAGTWQLPLIGFILSSLLFGVGLVVARVQGLGRSETGAFLCGSALSNIGSTYGGLVCLVVLGIQGLTLSQAYTIYITPFTFLVMFQVVAGYASKENAAGLRALLPQFIKDVARWLPILMILIGLALNFYAPRPPQWMNPVVTVWVLVMTAGYSFAIGASFQLGKIREHLKPCLALSAVKFIISPALAVGLMMFFHLTPLQKQVIFIESAMPMAIYAVVLTGLTGLSRDLANSCWLFTTIVALPLVLPLSVMVTRCLGG
jgi:predicted permease